nr:reverse transcriptase domain-containing protein [Tanacetum cinerariifolium]
ADDQQIVESSQHPEWFSQQKIPPNPDRDWNKTLSATHGSIQSWISELAKQSDSRSSFNELMDTPMDFSNFLMNRLKVDPLTPELLAGPTYELMKGSCKSLVELKLLLEEVYKATTDQLNWVNPEGASSRKYTTSVTKTKAADYGSINWIEDLVPRTMWIQEPTGAFYHRNRRRSKQPFILKASPVDTMADQRTMAELLRVPTEGYVEAILVPPFDESFHEAWDQYKDLLRACPYHGFTELHQLDTFYNALNPADQDSLNSAAGGNLLERRNQDVLKIIEKKSKIGKLTHAINQQTSAATTAMTAILEQFQATPPPASVKAVEEICVTCGGAHPYYQCLAADGNTFSEHQDNIQGYVSAAVVNYNQGNFGYRPLEETLTDQDIAEYTIKVPPPLVQKPKPLSQRNFVVHQRDSLHPNIPYPSRMHKQKQQEKDKVQIHKFWQMFKQLHINITLADALILILRYQKLLKALLFNKEKILELANTSLNENCLAVILKKLPEKLGDPGKFLIPCCFSELKYKALANLDHQSGSPTFSSHTNLTSPEVNDDIFDLEEDMVLIEKLINLDSTKDLPLPYNINPLSGSTTSSSSLNHLLEEFTYELSLITFPQGNDNLLFDIESDLKEIEYLLHYDPIKEMDSILEDSIDKDNLANLNDNLVDTMPEISSYFLPSLEYDSFLFENFFEVDALPSTYNEDKVFNPGILIQDNLSEVITRTTPDNNVKKIAISPASLIRKDFDPPLYELPFIKEVLGFETLLSFSSKNEEKVFKPRILTSKGVHSSLLSKLSHRGYKVFKIIKILKSPMEIFPCSSGERKFASWMFIVSISIPHE